MVEHPKNINSPAWGRRSTAKPFMRDFFMKITEMNREQLRDHMKASRLIYRFDSNAMEWKHAFKLARLSGMENMDMECTKCITKVSEWISQ
jgi:hypothetical protein